MRRKYKLWLIPILLILGSALAGSLSIQAAENSGRAYQFIYGHANGHDLNYPLDLRKGVHYNGIIIPQYRYLRGIDGYSEVSLLGKDEYVEKYNKEFVKEKKGYKLEAIAEDKTIVEITNRKNGGYTAKGLKVGQTVIRFYETYLGSRQYLGCRYVYVRTGRYKEDIETIFVGSTLEIPATWRGYESFKTAPIPSNKSLFKKVKRGDIYYYQAIKTGETTATIEIEGVKETFRIKIVEPTITNELKKEYTFYEGYGFSMGSYFHLFDYYVSDDLLEVVSSDTDIVEVKKTGEYPWMYTKKPGSVKIKLYTKINNKTKYFGEFTIHVLKNNDPAYVNSLVNQPSIDSGADIDNQKKPSSQLSEKEEEYILLLNYPVHMRVGDSVQCHSITNNEKELKWKVSDTSIASINSSTGLLKAIKPGTVTITAYTSKVEESFQLTVVVKDSIIITGESFISGQDRLEYTADRSGVVWSISDSDMAIISEENGKLILYPIRPGTFTLYADNDTLHGELTITNEEIIFDEE